MKNAQIADCLAQVEHLKSLKTYMRIKSVVFVSALSAISFVSCTPSDTKPVGQDIKLEAASPSSTSGVHVDPSELSELINLQIEPEDVAWKETPGPKKRLLAVLQFSPADAKKVIENAAKISAGQAVKVSTEEWFPAELRAQSEISGDETVAAVAYPASNFFLSQYNSGSLAHVANTDFFILDLSAN